MQPPFVGYTASGEPVGMSTVNSGSTVEYGGRRWYVRWHHVFLLGWALIWFGVAERHGGQSWSYLRTGSHFLFGNKFGFGGLGGLDLYAKHPELQIGPISFLVASLFSYLSPAIGQLLAEAFMAGIAPFLLVLTGRCAATSLLGQRVDHRRLQRRVLMAGLAFIPMWTEVSVRFAHLDDVLALLFTALAVRALTRGGTWQVGMCLGLAIDSKPWAVGFVALLLAVPSGNRWRAARWMTLVVAAAWLPFVLYDFRNVAAGRFTIPIQHSSALRWLGVHDAGTPWWDRPAQAILGLALGMLAVRRGRWPAVVLLGANARIFLDPSTYTYYTASVLLGTLLWDTFGERRIMPVWSWLAIATLYAPIFFIPSGPIRGMVRILFLLVSTAYVIFWPGADRPPGRHRAAGVLVW